ncbi:MAG: penicillin-binding protein 1C, partial [Bacteroidetes bacterium]
MNLRKRLFSRLFLIKMLKLTGVGLAVCLCLFILLNLIFPLPAPLPYSTIVTDNKGQLMHAFLSADDKWRMKTELDEISPLLQQTILAKEDRWFYWHFGVNPFAVLRAGARNIFTGRRTSGASTITMQVARLMRPAKRTVGNKLIEMFRAFQLEWKYSKKEILQLYLNLLPYGGNIEGVKTAAWLYFDKNPDHLSLAEITALSIIPNRPTSLVLGKNNDAIVTERNKWLRRFEKERLFGAQIL